MTTVSEALRADLGDDVWVGPVSVHKVGWRRVYAAALLASDLSAGLIAAAAVIALQPGTGLVQRSVTAAAVVGIWYLSCLAAGSHDVQRMPRLSESLGLLIRVALVLAAVVGFVLLAAGLIEHRLALVVGLPTALGASMASRLSVHGLLRMARNRGRCFNRVIVVGGEEEVLDLVGRMRRDNQLGFAPVGACVPGGGNRLSLVRHQVPVVGDVWEAAAAAARLRASAVIVGAGAGIDSTVVRRLGWQLEGETAQLVVAPPISEVNRDRVTVSSLGAAPILHVSSRGRTPAAVIGKTVLESVLAFTALLLLAPVLLGIALAIRLCSPGPALFRQNRVGRDGHTFTLLKFRTMVANAHELRDELDHLNVHEDGPLFKIQRDPRVTRIGAWLRRTSLDELPQLINVLTGKMALVGPRPPLPSEASRYTDDVRRRLLVKPGLTGLWQVSGRADLTWEESVRLDLRYVENWSLGLDLAILCRTWSAVVKGKGAY